LILNRCSFPDTLWYEATARIDEPAWGRRRLGAAKVTFIATATDVSPAPRCDFMRRTAAISMSSIIRDVAGISPGSCMGKFKALMLASPVRYFMCGIRGQAVRKRSRKPLVSRGIEVPALV